MAKNLGKRLEYVSPNPEVRDSIHAEAIFLVNKNIPILKILEENPKQIKRRSYLSEDHWNGDFLDASVQELYHTYRNSKGARGLKELQGVPNEVINFLERTERIFEETNFY